MFPLRVWCASESRLRSLFFVEVGAAIIVESTIVPFFRISPFAVSCSTTCEKSFSCSSFFTNRFLNLPSVSPSGIWLLDSTPQKSENALLSVTCSTVASSAKLYKLNRRPSQSNDNSVRSKAQIKRREREKSSVRSKVEHVLGVVKGLLRYRKTRYKGLRKQTAKLNIMFALANLILADRPHLADWFSVPRRAW